MGMEQPWLSYMPPFRIWGNVYFVGTVAASTHIVDTGEGLIMLDSGYQHSLYIVLENMRAVGLNPMDIKYIVHTHGHVDHFGATRALVEMTGAKTFLGKPDHNYVNGTLDLSWAKELNVTLETFEPDILLNDGDTIALGNTTIKAVATPGHTPGVMSYVFEVTDGERRMTAALHGGAGLNTLKREFLDSYDLPYSCRDDYLKSMDRLKELTVDIYLGNHPYQNNTAEKYQKLIAGEPDAFVDPAAWAEFAEKCKKNLLALMESEL